MSAHLIDGVGTTDELAAIFSDTSVLQALLDVESALARAQARVGAIPADAAAVIAAAAHADQFDIAALARSAHDSGTVVIALVEALRERVGSRDPVSATFVHWGATSQDISDTALVLLLARARRVLAESQVRLERSLRSRSDEHAHTIMLGRTLLQPAAPTTFGLKVAAWYAGIHRSWNRLALALDAACVVQFAGAAGTLAASGKDGIEVRRALGTELGLGDSGGPWHTDRDRLAAVACGCGILTGSLAKMARDVSLLMQAEIGEAAEPGGGSSSMPHKRNPAGCAVVLAAATRTPGLVVAYLSGMIQEHERSVGGWHAEWPTLAALVQATGAASQALANVAEGLTVDAERMLRNIDATRGSVFSEQIVTTLSRALGYERAQDLLREAVVESDRTGEALTDVVRRLPEAAAVLSDKQSRALGRPEEYLGSAEALRLELLASQ